MKPKTAILVVAALTVAAVVIGAGVYFFAPRISTQMDEGLPDPTVAYTLVKAGRFEGSGDGVHQASGAVRLLRAPDGAHFLRFENYSATPGPDVYFYLTPAQRADTEAKVEGDGLLVPVPGGAGDGQATLRGQFNVFLPEDFDPDKYQGISAWCRRYNELFGFAILK